MVPVTADLKARRRALGKTQQQLAHEANCSIAMLKLLERGYPVERSDVQLRIEMALTEAEGRAA